MRVVDWRQGEFFAGDVLPDVELRPVGDGEDAQVFAGVQARVVKRPQLRPLVFWVPLAKFVAEGEDALFGACFFFVAPCAAKQRVEAVFFDGFQERYRLRGVARVALAPQYHRAARDGVFDVADD